MSWSVLLFPVRGGKSPVEIFLDKLDISTRAKAMRNIKLLEKHGPNLPMPHSKKMPGQLYELRIRGKTEIRIFYTFKNRDIFLLHAFQKKSQKTPAKEIEIANNRVGILD